MKKIKIEAELEVFESVSELSEEIKNLMNKAQQARDKAYAPYSRFMVGAAILLENGEVVCGNNQENAAYPSGLCAERVAIFSAGAQYPTIEISRMCLSVRSLNYEVDRPTPPCGACRQSMAEYEVKQKKPIELYFMGETGKVVKSNSVADLLPLVFDNSYL